MEKYSKGGPHGLSTSKGGGGSTWKIGPSKALSLRVGGKCGLVPDGNDGKC